jgi:MFS family permease
MEKKNLYKWELLFWLWFAFFFNQADRQVFNIVLPLIKADLGFTDTQLGLIASIFVLCVGIGTLISGFVGDLFSRKKIIVISIFVWSAATFFTGISYTIVQLIFLRSLAVGGGEAFYAPSANAIICEHYGWRSCFYLFGGIGIILAIILSWRIKPAKIVTHSSSFSETKKFIRDAFSILIKKPSAMLLGGSFVCLVFVNVGYLTWMPSFIHEKFNQTVTQAGFSSMFYHHAFAFIGIIFGGMLSDKLAVKSKYNRLIIQSLGLLLGAPFIFGMGKAGTPALVYICLAGFGFFRGVYEANFVTTIFAVIEPKFRASVIGVVYLFVFTIGSLSPFLLGYFKQSFGLSDGLSALSIAYVLGGCCVLISLKWFFRKDSVLKTVEI